MKLTHDLSILFALLISAAIISWALPEGRPQATLYLGMAFVVLVFLLLALTVEVERLRKRIEELNAIQTDGERGRRGS